MVYGEVSRLNIGSEGESQSGEMAFHLLLFLNFILSKGEEILLPPASE